MPEVDTANAAPATSSTKASLTESVFMFPPFSFGLVFGETPKSLSVAMVLATASARGAARLSASARSASDRCAVRARQYPAHRHRRDASFRYLERPLRLCT